MSDQRQVRKPMYTEIGYERRDINIKRVLLAAAIIIGILLFSVIMLNEMFMIVKEDIVYQQFLSPESERLNRINAREDSVLNSYGVIAEEKGKYRIPVEKAMEIIAEEADRQDN